MKIVRRKRNLKILIHQENVGEKLLVARLSLIAAELVLWFE